MGFLQGEEIRFLEGAVIEHFVSYLSSYLYGPRSYGRVHWLLRKFELFSLGIYAVSVGNGWEADGS